MLNKLRKIAQTLNPQNTLFRQIFVWFWLAVTAMVICAFVVARLLGQTWDLSAPSETELSRGQELQASVQHQLDKKIDIKRALRRVGARGRSELMVIDDEKLNFILGFPRPLLSQRERFLSLNDAQQVLLIRTNNMEFLGPFKLRNATNNYFLYVGKLLPRAQQHTFVIAWALGVFLLLGTLAVIAISFALVKPIKRLGQLSKEFANGNEIELDSKLAKRKDELGQLHQDIYYMATKLAQSLVKQKALMANVSHELRTPLTRMQLALAMLDPKDESGILYAQRIEKEISVMDSLIGQALQLATIDDQQHKAISQTQLTSLPSVLEPILDDLAFEAQGFQKTFNASVCPDLDIMLNPISFASAVENVMRNAIKYCASKVQVNIQIMLIEQQKILRISIEDDGDGLDAKQIEQIFEPFYRAHSGIQQEGTGLGLAIAKAAIELHKGKINVYESSLGGLKIELNFPVE